MTGYRILRLSVGQALTGVSIVTGIAGLLLLSASLVSASESSAQPVPDTYLPELVQIPAGELAVTDPDPRSTQGGDPEARHVVFERPFLIGKFEITFEQWTIATAPAGARIAPTTRDGVGRTAPSST